MAILGLRPVEWAIVAIITAIVIVVGRLPEREAKPRGKGRGTK